MRKKRLSKRHWGYAVVSVLFLCAVAGVVSSSRTALATPGSMFFSTQLAVALFDEINVLTVDPNFGHAVAIRTKGASDVYYNAIRVPPGGYSGWHTHPGPSLVAVTAGTAAVYSGDDPTCTPRFYQAGAGWIDEGGGHLHNVRNEGNVDLEEVVFQIVPSGAPRRIDAASPSNCPF